jgi:hypothetical protein
MRFMSISENAGRAWQAMIQEAMIGAAHRAR